MQIGKHKRHRSPKRKVSALQIRERFIVSYSNPHDPHSWETLSSHYLARKPWLTVRQERVRLPAGGIIEEYWVSEFPSWVNVIAVTLDGRLVLIRQYRHGLGRIDFEIPAGVCEPSDAMPLAAAQRELLEETGYGGGTWSEWMVLSANPALQNNLTHSFLALNVECQCPQKLEATEELSVHLVTLAEARRILLEGEMVQALHLAPLLKFFLLRAESVTP
jgi:8-oxo-dGTP pyrophosphatase MutT (NUDIX family)